MRAVKNIGQFHPRVRWVIKLIGTPLESSYRGCGVCRATPGMTALEYVDEETDPEVLEARHPGQMYGVLSCYELIAAEGTAFAAYLNASGGEL